MDTEGHDARASVATAPLHGTHGHLDRGYPCFDSNRICSLPLPSDAVCFHLRLGTAKAETHQQLCLGRQLPGRA